MSNLKNNAEEALASVGELLFEGTPKSTFALVAFHFAQQMADDFTVTGARNAIAQEIVTLADNGLEWTAKGTARASMPVTIRVRSEKQRELDKLVDRFDQ